MRLVLIRLSALGDVVHTWPLALALRKGLPEVHLTWVVEEPLRPLIQGHPAIDAVVTVATRRWRKAPLAAATRAEMGAVRTRLRELSADVSIDPQGTLKSALVTRWTGATDRIGLARPWRRELLAGPAYTRTAPGSEQHHHVVATNVALSRALGIEPEDPLPFPDGHWLLRRIGDEYPGLRPSQAYAVLLPGAGHPSKVLAPETLAAVASDLGARALEPVVAWGPGERHRAEIVVGLSAGAATLAPATTVEELTFLLAGARIVVGGDTGPVHLAASLGVPTLGVFLTTDRRRNGPLGHSADVISSATPIAPERPKGSARAIPGTPPTAAAIGNRLATMLNMHH